MIPLLVPIIATFFWYLLKFATGPYWQFPDPAYGYLSSSLSLIKGFSPTFVYQPGTSVEILGSAIILLLNFGHSTAETVHRVLLNPEFYLHVINLVMIVFSFWASYLLGAYIYQLTRDKLAVLLTQLPLLSILSLRSYSFYDYILPVVTNVSPEPLLIGISCLFNLYLLKLYFAKQDQEQIAPTIILGLICGLGISSKLIFCFFLLLPVLVCRGRQKLLFLAVSILSAVVCTIPIIPHYDLVWQWVVKLTTHTEKYGAGNPGFINLPEYLWYCQHMLFTYSPMTFFGIIVIILTLIKTFRKGFGRGTYFILAIALCILVQLALIAKHFDEHYLVSTLNLFGPLFVIFYLNVKNKNLYFKTLISFCIVLYLIQSLVSAWDYNKWLSGYTKDAARFNEVLHTKYPDFIYVAIYPMPLLCPDAAFFWGNDRDNKQQNELSDLYPKNLSYYTNNSYDYAPYVYGIYSIKQRIMADDLLNSGAHVLFVGPKGYDFSQTPYTALPIEQGKYAAAYLLIKSTEKMAENYFNASIKLTEKGDYLDAFILALKSKELHYQPDDKVSYLISVLYPHVKRK